MKQNVSEKVIGVMKVTGIFENVHWLQALPLPIAAKSSILNVVEF